MSVGSNDAAAEDALERAEPGGAKAEAGRPLPKNCVRGPPLLAPFGLRGEESDTPGGTRRGLSSVTVDVEVRRWAPPPSFWGW
jgi:hypothetical protein